MRASETALAHRRRGDAVRPVLILVALRPVIDLAGESSGGALAPGGLYALAVAALVLWQLVASRGEVWVPFFAAVLSLALFVVADLHRPLHYGAGIAAVFEVPVKYFSGICVFIHLACTSAGDDETIRAELRLFHLAFCIALLVPAAIALLQYAGLHPFSYFDYIEGVRTGRPSGGYRQPNSFARLFVVFAVLSYVCFDRKILSRRLLYGSVAIALFFVALSTHRSSLAILVAVIVICEYRRRHFIAKSALVLAIVAMLAATGIARSLPGYHAFESLFAIWGEDGLNLRGRQIWFAQAVEMFSDFNMFEKIFGIGYEPFIIDNGYMHILLSQGLTGLALFLFTVSATLWIHIRRRPGSGYVALCVAVILGTYMIVMSAHTATHLLWMLGALLFFSQGAERADPGAPAGPLRRSVRPYSRSYKSPAPPAPPLAAAGARHRPQ